VADTSVADARRSRIRAGAGRSIPRTASAMRTARTHARVVLPDQPVRQSRLVANEAAVRAFAFADDEIGRRHRAPPMRCGIWGQVVQVRGTGWFRPSAGLHAPVLDDLEVVGLALGPGGRQHVAARGPTSPSMSSSRPRGALDARRAGRRSSAKLPVARAWAKSDLGQTAIERACVVVGAHHVEREVLEQSRTRVPSPSGGRAVGAAEEMVVDRLGGPCEAIGGGTRDRPRWRPTSPVIGSLRSSKSPAATALRSRPARRRVPSRAPARTVSRRALPDSVVGRASGSPSSAAIEVDRTSGIPHGSISPKSARSTVTLRASPVVASRRARPAGRGPRSCADPGRSGRNQQPGWPSRRPAPTPSAAQVAARAASSARTSGLIMSPRGAEGQDRIGDQLARPVIVTSPPRSTRIVSMPRAASVAASARM